MTTTKSHHGVHCDVVDVTSFRPVLRFLTLLLNSSGGSREFSELRLDFRVLFDMLDTYRESAGLPPVDQRHTYVSGDESIERPFYDKLTSIGATLKWFPPDLVPRPLFNTILPSVGGPCYGLCSDIIYSNVSSVMTECPGSSFLFVTGDYRLSLLLHTLCHIGTDEGESRVKPHLSFFLPLLDHRFVEFVKREDIGFLDLASSWRRLTRCPVPLDSILERATLDIEKGSDSINPDIIFEQESRGDSGELTRVAS
jgi:hypothetical protein